jgi:GDPmannose 4,6-dehydratase
VKQDPSLMRPTDPSRLVGNAAKAQRLLNWKPEITFEQMITEMVNAELADAEFSITLRQDSLVP